MWQQKLTQKELYGGFCGNNHLLRLPFLLLQNHILPTLTRLKRHRHGYSVTTGNPGISFKRFGGKIALIEYVLAVVVPSAPKGAPALSA